MKREKAIKQVLEWDFLSKDDKEVLAVLIPELRESEDERIRKRLIDCLKFSLSGAEEQDAAGCNRQKDIEAYKWGIAYLEKQKEQKDSKVVEFDHDKEQKPAEWSDEDIKRLYSIGNQIGFLKGKYSEYQKDIDWLYALADKMGFHKCKTGEVVTEWKKEDIDDKMLSKPKQEWSEDDERIMQTMIKECDLKPSEIAWLKSLRPQPKQDWSDEDEEMRLEAIRVLVSGCERYRKQSGCLPCWHKVIAWLKSLRSRPIKADNWKPSEEQMKEVSK